MKILLVSGHKSGYNYSARTKVNEGDLNIELVKNLKTILDEYVDVDAYDYTRDMYKDLLAGKAVLDLKAYDYIFEVHFNASSEGAAEGTSIYLHTDYTGGTSVERTILDNMEAIGFRLRGSKGFNRKNTLLNMNTAQSLGIDYALLETCFYDNKNDMEKYQSNKYNVAWAIADGILYGFGLYKDTIPDKPAESPDEPTHNTMYKVQVGAFSKKSNAEKLKVDLETLGYKPYIKEE